MICGSLNRFLYFNTLIQDLNIVLNILNHFIALAQVNDEAELRFFRFFEQVD